MKSNITAAAALTENSSSLGSAVVIPILAVFSVIVLILIVILIAIFCRRKVRAQRLRSDSELGVQAIKATKKGNHVTLENEESLDGFHSVRFTVPSSPMSKRKDLELNLEQKRIESKHSPQPAVNGAYVEFQMETTQLDPTSMSLQGSHPTSLQSVQTPLTTLQEETAPSYKANGGASPAVITDSHCRTAVHSTPELHKLRARRSRDIIPLQTSGHIVDNKEATLKRASNLFRSNTKAYEFYTKTITNYELKRDNLKTSRPIGRGHFGCVYLGEAAKLPNCKWKHVQVAIKTMKSSAPDSEKQEFLYELEIMKLVNSLNHANIIKLLACCTKSQPYLIVLELMENGNLQKFLRDTKSGDVYYNLHGQSDSLNDQHLLKFALDIARGMEGIADLQLLHRDLAARNILVNDSLTCKVADFGFAKDVLNKPEYKSKSVFQRPRPTRWLPPESLFTFKHCIQSDVWSYGVVLWEIVTLGNLPYPNMNTREVMKSIARGYRMPCPPHCSPDIYRVMAECWEEKWENRPSFKQIVGKIEELLRQSTDSGMIDMKRLHEDDYVDALPSEEHEIMLEYAASETLC